MESETIVKNKSDLQILVVEDDWIAINICIKLLMSLGYENIETAYDGKAALVIMEKTGHTPERYPRRPGMPVKRPVL